MGGKLLALKPDVTLSIIKNGEDIPGYKQKVCYNENVYRVSGSTHHFKEILQTGLECIGDLDTYDICEVVTLAAASLDTVSHNFVLDVSHMGILSAILEDIGTGEKCPSGDRPLYRREEHPRPDPHLRRGRRRGGGHRDPLRVRGHLR